MSEDNYLADDLLRQLMNVGEVDLLVGIAPHTDAGSVRQAIQTIERSFWKYFVRQRAVIVSFDRVEVPARIDPSQLVPALQGSHQRTPAPTSLRTIAHVTASSAATPANGFPIRTILASADLLRARACAVISPNTSSLSPEWVANLLGPVFRENFDFAAPLYTRHKYEGLLARCLLYPMSRALLGCGIRELYSDDWGFSGGLATLCLNQNIWREDTILARPAGWMAVSGISERLRFCQAHLGQKLQSSESPAPSLVEVLRETVGSLFSFLELYDLPAIDSKERTPIVTFGSDHDLTVDSSVLDLAGLFEMSRTGVIELEPVLNSILEPATHEEIRNLASLEPYEFRFGAELWVRTIYDFAASYHHAVINRDHLIQALVPLYRGMTYSYLSIHSESTPSEMEAGNEALCVEFERQKPYLKEKWKAHSR